MRFHLRLGLVPALGLWLVACADARLPEPQPIDAVEPIDPEVDVRPTTVPEPAARACRVDPGAAPWLSAAGPRETLPRRLAATPGALFVASPFGLRRSTDAGQTFELVSSPASGATPRPMVGLDGTLFIGTDLGSIRSEDGGATWLDASAGLDGGVVELFGGRASLLARSATGSLFSWSAVDAEWHEVESGSSYSAGVAASDGKTVLVDTGNGVLRSTDGSSWSLVNGLEAWGYEALLVADELGLAITASGEIRRSEDAGIDWLPVQQSTAEIGVASRLLEHGDAMFALTSSGVVRSSDGGASWGIALTGPSQPSVTEIAQADDLLAVDVGTISVTTDGGATWLEAERFIDSTPVAFGRVGSWLLTSTAAAGVFVSSDAHPFQPTNASGFFLRDVEESLGTSYLLFSQQPSFHVGYGLSWATRTSDGGASFEAVPLPDSGDAMGRSFDSIAVDGEVILAGGADPLSPYGPGVWVSSNGGQSWLLASAGLPEIASSDVPLYPAVLSLARRGDGVVALLDDAGVFETRDHGQSWQPIGDLPPAQALDADTLLVVGETLYLSSRTSGSALLRFAGEGWQAVTTTGLPEAPRFEALTAAGSTLIASVAGGDDDAGDAGEGEGGGVYLSNDRGHTWQSLGLSTLPRARALFVDGETLFAGVEAQGTFSLDLGPCQ